ncbi:hypothetical protein JOE63_003502 [Cellulosimicrobium cellulans]|uniref:hypothetical protein n=1 Tax=Cellulosimicrobium cellulans TaxID=1710 RepID=UPI00195C995F|nr:hypothetical protein [Cellulosimicrobium cellulans]MBM7821025.1 hypothetical protein [Cellulosimicrobium cellulans]
MTASPPPGAVAGPAPVETALTVARISSFDASTARLRDVAKWFATSTVALVAFLAAAFPVAGVVSDSGALTPVALVWGTGVLVSLGAVVVLASRVLAPQVVSLGEIATHARFAELRSEIAKEPATFLGLWAADVPGLLERRERVLDDQRRVMETLKDPAVPADQREAFVARRAAVERDLTVLGWVSYRLESAGLYALTWGRFTTLRMWSAVAALVAAVCLVGLVASVRDVTAQQYRGAAVTFTFLDSVSPAPTALLGQDCPGVVSGELVSTTAAPPWVVRVTEEGCERAILHLEKESAVLVFRDR